MNAIIITYKKVKTNRIEWERKENSSNLFNLNSLNILIMRLTQSDFIFYWLEYTTLFLDGLNSRINYCFLFGIWEA